MKSTDIIALSLALGGFASAALAQEVLPFPPTPSASTAGLTMQESVHKKRVTTSRLQPGAPLKVTLKIDGKTVAEGQAPISAPLAFTANDCLDIGSDLGSPVSTDYFDEAPFTFNGTIGNVHVEYTK